MDWIHKKRKSFVQWFITFFILLILASVASINMINRIYAASVTGLTDTTISLSNSGGTWEASGTSITGRVEAKKSSGCDGDTYSSQTGTLTIKNGKSGPALLYFEYSVVLNGGSVKVNGTSVSSGSSFSTNLNSNASIDVVLASNASNSNQTSISITNISLVGETTVTGHFLVGEHGSYTVNGSTVTSDFEPITQSSQNSFEVIATPASGYDFFGWHVASSSVGIDATTVASVSSTYNFMSEEDFYIKPEFIPSGTALFTVGGVYYNSLTAANNAAKNGSTKVIVAAKTGTVAAGSYTISNGVTLLIPFNDANTLYTTLPETITSGSVTHSLYRKITLQSGVAITVESGGAISIGSKMFTSGNNSNGVPSGPYGMIQMTSGSTITLNNNSNLYCWGYIGGSGDVKALSGASVYECFQIRDWRGGSAASDIVGNNYKIFLIQQYYVQNIEANLWIYSGAKEYVVTGVFMSKDVPVLGLQTANPTPIVLFISDDVDSSMFAVNSGYLIKSYNPNTDILNIDIYGEVVVGSFSMDLTINLAGLYNMNIDIKTKDYVLPINNNINIAVHNSSKLSIKSGQDIAMLPGSSIQIDEGGEMTINSGANFYIFDVDEWSYMVESAEKGFCGASNNILTTVQFNTVKSTNASSVRTWANMKANNSDAKLDINGTLKVNGQMYTTAGGANICTSNKSGEIVYSQATTTGSLYEYTQNGTTCTQQTISITSAKLKNNNVNQPFTETVNVGHASDMQLNPSVSFHWDDGSNKWVYGNTAATINLIFEDTNGTEVYRKSNFIPNSSCTFPLVSALTTPLSGIYSLKYWKDSDNNLYLPGETRTISEVDDVTFVAFYGGWIGSGAYYKYHTYDGNAGDYASGLFEVGESQLVNGSQVPANSICYFYSDTNYMAATYSGMLKNDFAGGDNKYYYVNQGVVQKNAGVIYLDTDNDGINDSYYYIRQDGTAYTSGVYYICTNLNNLLPAGYYEFEDDGKIIVTGLPHHITNNVVKDNANNTIYGAGLFFLTSDNPAYFYYCKEDGTIVKNQTFYVSKTNNCWIQFGSQSAIYIEEGLYYFDNDGHMWYGNNVLGPTAPVEFSVIVTGNVNGTTITIGGGN